MLHVFFLIVIVCKSTAEKQAAEKAIRHEKSLHVIEGRRAAREHQLELERRAAAAAHEASFAGLMNPFDWAAGNDDDDNGAAEASTPPEAPPTKAQVKPSAEVAKSSAAGKYVPDFTKFTLFT